MRRLALYVVLASLVGLLAPAASASPAAERVHRLKVMPLGDSITYGVGSKTGDGYRYALYWRLIEAGLPVDYVGSLTAGRGPEDANEGHRGWTIEQLSEHVDEWLETYEPDVILLHIGTNDMVRGVPDAPTHLDELLDRIAEDRPAAEVFVAKIVGIADYREVGSRMRRTTAYNAAVTRIVASKVALPPGRPERRARHRHVEPGAPERLRLPEDGLELLPGDGAGAEPQPVGLADAPRPLPVAGGGALHQPDQPRPGHQGLPYLVPTDPRRLADPGDGHPQDQDRRPDRRTHGATLDHGRLALRAT
ncbi:GDSL-type esterase/lipase family protein [Paractinoplanes durhamensis]|uniref:GDSL-type esterase/lipase family protein n=1 Tax=Paractinoplanes durhamensis TaxID=113563 RepID=UPI00362B5533